MEVLPAPRTLAQGLREAVPLILTPKFKLRAALKPLFKTPRILKAIPSLIAMIRTETRRVQQILMARRQLIWILIRPPERKRWLRMSRTRKGLKQHLRIMPTVN